MCIVKLSNQQKIWQVVSQIPAGRVASYAQVAQQAGIGRAARLVGNVLKKLPPDSQLPWHRVVNSQRKISLPPHTPGHQQQKQRLLAEGVQFANNKILAEYFFWR